jgi:hypothetical protein
MQSFDEFAGEVAAEAARRRDEEGLGYNLHEGILRALHDRVAKLEDKDSGDKPAENKQDVPDGQLPPQQTVPSV